jgi:hypothetical protein
LNDFAVVADFNVMRVSREKPAEIQCKANTRALKAQFSHSNHRKTEVQISDANVCKSTIPAKEHECGAGQGKRTDFSDKLPMVEKSYMVFITGST